jgi:myo-inositol-1(or 4)-monophosphatase
MEWNEICAWATALAVEAGERAVAIVAKSPKVTFKADGSLVTEVDTAIERFVRERIGAQFPDHAILGEEFGGDIPDDRPLWAIDPIDGTTNLANGIPHWGVSLGLVVGGVPTVGALCFPVLGETYAAYRGGGATLNGAPLPTLPPGGELGDEDPYSICTTCLRVFDLTQMRAKYRLFGSSALEICWAATGRVRGAQSVGVALWDVAAAACVAHEVGCTVAYINDLTPWDALTMAREGKRKDDAVAAAPSATLAFVQQRLRR